jgi:putative ABC transport system permease protein
MDLETAPPPPTAPHAAHAGGPTSVSLLSLLLAAALMLTAFLGASRRLGLELERAVLTAGFRCAAQLSLLGYILVPIFRLNAPPLSLAWTGLMATVAALEAAARPKLRYAAMRRHVFCAVLAAGFASLFWGLFIVLRVGLEAQYLIPLMGMLLGNTSSAVAVALTSVTSALSEGAAAVEARLALGASRWEATHAVLRNACHLGLTPVLNGMSIMGLVSIPGMMTGQILGGTPPALAARYQITTMFLIAASAALSVTGAAALAVSACTDGAHRLHAGALTRREEGGAGDPMRVAAARAVGAAAAARAAAAEWWRKRQQHGGGASVARGSGSGGGGGGGGGDDTSAPLLDAHDAATADDDDDDARASP